MLHCCQNCAAVEKYSIIAIWNGYRGIKFMRQNDISRCIQTVSFFLFEINIQFCDQRQKECV